MVVADVWDDLRPEHRYAFLQRAPAQVGLLGRDALWQDGQLVHQPGMERFEHLHKESMGQFHGRCNMWTRVEQGKIAREKCKRPKCSTETI